MRIVHVNTEEGWRGGEQQLLLLVEALRTSRPDIEHALVCQPGSPLAEHGAHAGIPVHPLAMGGAMDRRASKALGRLPALAGATFVHAHTSHAHSIAWRAVKAHGAARPRLLVSRHVAYSIHRHVPLGLARRKYEHGCDHLLAVSDAVRAQLVQDGVSAERITVVRGGIDTEAWTVDAEAGIARRAAVGIPSSAQVVGILGALTPEKGHDTLLDAFALLEPERRGRHLLVVGTGPRHDELGARVQALRLAGHVHLVGFQGDVVAWQSAMDVVAAPSLREGLSLVVMQAMAAGLPVVGSGAGGMAELLVDPGTARTVPAGNAAAWAAALADLLEDDAARRAVGAAAQAHARAHFDIARVAAETATLYERLSAA